MGWWQATQERLDLPLFNKGTCSWLTCLTVPTGEVNIISCCQRPLSPSLLCLSVPVGLRADRLDSAERVQLSSSNVVVAVSAMFLLVSVGCKAIITDIQEQEVIGSIACPHSQTVIFQSNQLQAAIGSFIWPFGVLSQRWLISYNRFSPTLPHPLLPLFVIMDDGCWDVSSRFGAVPAADGQTEMKRPEGARGCVFGWSERAIPFFRRNDVPRPLQQLCSRPSQDTNHPTVPIALSQQPEHQIGSPKNVTVVCTSTIAVLF